MGRSRHTVGGVVRVVQFCVDAATTLRPEVEQLWLRHAGCARKAWNRALGEVNDYHAMVSDLVHATAR